MENEALIVQAIAQTPIIAVLIYVIMKQQAQHDRLMTAFVEREREHAKDIISIICGARSVPD